MWNPGSHIVQHGTKAKRFESQPCPGVVTVLLSVLVGWLWVGGFVEVSLAEVRVRVDKADGGSADVVCVAVRWRAS